MNKFINFEVEQAEIIEEKIDSQFATAKVQAFSSDKNRHDMICSEEVLKKTAPSIYNKPILYNIDRIFDDFSSHSDPDKSLIAGFVVPNSSDFIRLDDGRLSLNVLIKIWKRYAPKAMEIFKRDLGRKKVSVEMELLEAEVREDDIIEMKDFVYSGICLLGDLLTEASPGARIEVLSFAKENEEYKKAFLSEFSLSQDEEFILVPENIVSNIQEGLNLYKDNNYSQFPTYFGIAEYIVKNKKIDINRFNSLISLLKKNDYKNISKSFENNNYVEYRLCGGKDGIDWFEEVDKKIEKKLFSFDNLLTFPYKSKNEINPALKGIKPPISLSQANEIARQADAIGVSKEQNGWAIAIANFKKTHTIKNGVWVKKENKNMELDKENVQKEGVEKEKLEFIEEGNEAKEKEIEKPEEESEKDSELEEEEKDEENEKEEEESFGSKVDSDSFLSLFINKEKEMGVLKEEFSKTKDIVNYEQLIKNIFLFVKNEISLLKEENKSLLAFKEAIEVHQFESIVNSTLKEIEESVEIPQEVLLEMQEKSKNFNLGNVDAWKNECKALAFNFAVKDKKEAEDEVKVYGLPWGSKENDNKHSIWD